MADAHAARALPDAAANSDPAAAACQICLDAAPDLRLAACGHAFCGGCVADLVAARLDAGAVLALRCPWRVEQRQGGEQRGEPPGDECGAPLSPLDVHAAAAAALGTPAAGAALSRRYALLHALASDACMRECPACGALQRGDAAAPAMRCGDCGARFCFEHASAHAHDVPCSEYAAATAPAATAEGALLEAALLASGEGRRCPRCQRVVVKAGGCNHIRCHCGASFCWLCGAVRRAAVARGVP